MNPIVKLGVFLTFALGIINIAICLSRFLMIHLDQDEGAQSSSLTIIGKSLLIFIFGPISIDWDCEGPVALQHR